MQHYAFRFGYENPVDHDANRRLGTDGESNSVFVIEAESESAAMSWGREVATQFVRWLFEREGQTDPNWLRSGFAHWVDLDVDHQSLGLGPTPPRVRVGEFPVFESLLPGARFDQEC